MEESIWDALESTTTPHFKISFNERTTANKHEITLWKKHLLSFLEEIEGEITVGEIREALYNYRGA